jgi:Zn-dependent protease
MPWSLTIGRVGGTAVKIHVTFLLFLAWIGFSAWEREGPAAALDSLIFIVLLFLCVTLHEFGHILMARRFGIETPQVTLLPIGGVASLQRLPTNPIQEFLVAIAGPAVNLVIGGVLILLLGRVAPERLSQLDDPDVSLLARLAAANLFLVVFNLIPAFPMDGGRVLHAFLSIRLGPQRATQVAATIGQALAFVFGFLGLFGNPLLLFIAIFIYIAASAEARMSSLQEALTGLSVADAMETRFTAIPIEANLAQAVEALMSTAQHEFPVVDGFSKPVGLLTPGGHPRGAAEPRPRHAGRDLHAGSRPDAEPGDAGADGARKAPDRGDPSALRDQPGRRHCRPRHASRARRADDDQVGSAGLAIRAPRLAEIETKDQLGRWATPCDRNWLTPV